MVKVELVYVTQEGVTLHFNLDLNDGACVADALTGSGIFDTHPETRELPVGIFSKQVPLETLLKENDRVELYRPLTRDPKDKRRHRALVKK